jgi:hypothetical protein
LFARKIEPYPNYGDNVAISIDDVQELRKRKVLKHKFGAVSCERDQKKFPSRLERRYYDELKIRQASGEVIFFLRQTPFEIGGGVKYVVDFTVFLADGTIEFVDTKGRDTKMSIAKRKIVEHLYPVEIKIVTKV